MDNRKGLQLIELLLAITLLAGIALTGNILLMGSANRSLTVKAKAEMGEQLNYLFKRIENFTQDIQPGLTDDPTLFNKSVSTPYVSSQAGLSPRWPAADASVDADATAGLDAGGLYLAFFSNATSPPPNPLPLGFGIFFIPLPASQQSDPNNRREGKLEFYSKDPGTKSVTREIVIPNGLFPYAAVEDYDKSGTIDSVDLTAIQTCLSNFNTDNTGKTNNTCVDRPGKSIWPVFEIPKDGKHFSVSFQMGRKVGGQMVYSRPMTQVFLIRGEKVSS
jgi:hypothetical protein